MEETHKTVVTISMIKVNILVLIASIGMMAVALYIHVLLFGNAVLTVTLPGFLLFLTVMFIFIVLHEAIHLIGFRYIGGVPKRELDWGFNWKMMVAYAHVKRPITVKQMKKVLLLPFVPTGLLPFLAGISINAVPLTIMGVILTAGCFGDFVLYRKLLKFPEHALVLDRPAKPGFTVYE
jgi:hypothetical protein